MRQQVLILSLFAMLWGLAALAVDGASSALLAAPVAVTAILIAAGWKILPPTNLAEAESKRIRLLVRRWSIVEVVCVAGAVYALRHVHAPELISAAIAIIVGLHFLPLARGIPERSYYVTGVALVAMGVLVPVLATGYLRLLLPLATGAIILWLSAVGVILWPRNQLAPH
jgi:hypothetical protein